MVSKNEDKGSRNVMLDDSVMIDELQVEDVALMFFGE